MHHSIAHIFFSFLPSSWFICLFMTKRGRVYWSLPECIVIFIWLMCTFLRGKNHKGDAYTKGEKIFFMRKPYFVCFTLCLFSHCFIVLWVTFSIYTLLLSSHRVFVLNMHLSLCYYALLVAYLDDHLLCYMIIVVISIWLFWCMIKLLTCFTSCLLDRNLLVTLYLSIYHLIYLEGLMYFVQVFQVTGIYVPNSSQLLDLGVSEFCHFFQTHI